MATLAQIIAKMAAANAAANAAASAKATSEIPAHVNEEPLASSGRGTPVAHSAHVPAGTNVPVPVPPTTEEINDALRASGVITLDEKQELALSYATQGKSFVLIGPAGSGKTTTLARSAMNMLQNFKKEEVAMVAFTNTAANNIKRAMARYPELADFAASSISTIHTLLGFHPEECYVEDEEKGELRKSMRFVPKYHESNKLAGLRLVIIEEASMLGLDLWKQLHDALVTDEVSFVFVGDINQIPPVFGDSILGYKLLELPVVELTTIYRQALESPIIAFQHKYTLPGITPGDTLLKDTSGLQWLPMKTYFKDADSQLDGTAAYFRNQFLAGGYNPEEDMILMPYNKSFGTIGLNTRIAQFLGRHREAVVYEVVSGFERRYLAVGDRVRYKKEEYFIEEIIPNPDYNGVEPMEPSVNLTRLGTHLSGPALPQGNKEEWSFDDIITQVDSLNMSDSEVKNQASHLIKIRYTQDRNVLTTLRTRGELGEMDFGYAMTIHKSQGSEWDKVFLILTRHHGSMLCREILYTGMTRARTQLVMMYSPQSMVGKKDSSIAKCIANPRISGSGWEQKRKYFEAKFHEYEAHMRTDSSGLTAEDRALMETIDAAEVVDTLLS